MDSLDLQVLGQARDWRADGHAVWLVTVIETWGSAPRPPGALLTLFDRPSEEIARLHGPISLDIGSRTPAEIAVSIAAELVAVRNGVALAQKKPGSALPVAAPTTRT